MSPPLPGPQLPWPAARRPLSVVAFANSVGTLQMPPRSDRAQGTYVEVLADLLAAEGVPAVPRQESRWFDFLPKAMREYEQRLRVHAPDVVIVQFGLNEYQPWLLPIWVVRHLLTHNQASTLLTKGYRRYVSPTLWRWVRDYRRAAAPYVGLRTWQTTPRRFEGQMRRLLRNLRLEGRPLVLVLDIDVPNDKLEHFLPGMRVRHQRFQDILARVVSEHDPDEVRLVRVSELTAELGPSALPDGMHYTPETHEALGRLLADEVLTWLRRRGAQARPPGA